MGQDHASAFLFVAHKKPKQTFSSMPRLFAKFIRRFLMECKKRSIGKNKGVVFERIP